MDLFLIFLMLLQQKYHNRSHLQLKYDHHNEHHYEQGIHHSAKKTPKNAIVQVASNIYDVNISRIPDLSKLHIFQRIDKVIGSLVRLEIEYRLCFFFTPVKMDCKQAEF